MRAICVAGAVLAAALLALLLLRAARGSPSLRARAISCPGAPPPPAAPAVVLAQRSQSRAEAADVPRVVRRLQEHDMRKASTWTAAARPGAHACWWTGGDKISREPTQIFDDTNLQQHAPALTARLLLAADGIFSYVLPDEIKHMSRVPNPLSHAPARPPRHREWNGPRGARRAREALDLMRPAAARNPALCVVEGRPTRRVLQLALASQHNEDEDEQTWWPRAPPAPPGARARGGAARVEICDEGTVTTFHAAPRARVLRAHRGAADAWLVPPKFSSAMQDAEDPNVSHYIGYEPMPAVHHARAALRAGGPALCVPAGWWLQLRAAQPQTALSTFFLESDPTTQEA